MGYNKIKNWFWVLFGLIPFLGHSQIDNDWPRFELYQLVQGTDSGQFVITSQDSNLIFTDFLKLRFADTTLTLGGDTVLIKRRVWPLEAGLGIQIDSNWDNRTLFITSLTIEDTVKNQTGTLIPKGTPLYATGSQGEYWTVAPADAADSLKIPVVGIAGENIADGDDGKILIKGHIRQVNTTGLPNGAEVYLKPGGGYTNIKPKGNGVFVQRLGTVIKGNTTNGSGIINLGEPEMGLSPDHFLFAGADSVIYRTNLFTVLDTFNFRDSTRLLTDSVLAHYGKNGVLYKYDTIRTFFDQTRLSSDTILQHFNRVGTLLKADTIRTPFDQTRLFSDSILQHFNQIGTLLKADTIRLPIGATAVTFWDSINSGLTYDIYNKNTSGKVGINTTNPQYTLDVNGNLNASGTARFQNGEVVVTTDGYLGINKPSPIFELDVDGQMRNTSNAFLALGAGKLLVDTSSGTTGQAGYKLEVNGDVNIFGEGTAYRINGTPIGATTINNNADNRVITGSATSNTLEGEANLTYDGTDMVNNSGTSGSFKAKQFIANATGTLDNGLRLFNSGTGTTGGDGMKVFTKGNELEITNYENSNIVLQTYFDVYSDVGLRKAIVLKASGVVQFEDYGSGTLSTDADGNISASDGRLKTVVNKLDSGLDKILKLNPVYYKWNKDSGFNTEFQELGFIAQDVKKVIPEAVPNEESQTIRLNYSDRAIIATLVKAVQEQQIQIEQLKQEIKRIKNKDQ
jgi:hypothetical protein